MSTANNNGRARRNHANNGRGRRPRAGARAGAAAGRRGAPARKQYRSVVQLFEQAQEYINPVDPLEDSLKLEWYIDQQLEHSVDLEARQVERSTDWILTSLRDTILSADFHVFVNENERAGIAVARRLNQRLLQYSHPLCLRAFVAYPTGITNIARCFLLERTSSSCPAGSFKVPFEQKELDRLFRTSYTDEEIFVMGKQALKPSSVGIGSWSYQLSRSARGMVLSLLVHFVNWMAKLASVAQQFTEGPHTQRIINALNAVEGVVQLDDDGVHSFQMDYDCDEHQEDWIKKNVWDRLIQVLVEIMKNITVSEVSEADIDDSVAVLSKRGGERKLLSVGSQVSAESTWSKLFGKTDHCKALIAEIISMVWKILVKNNIATEQMAFDNTHQVHISVIDAMNAFFKRMLTAIRIVSTEDYVSDIYLRGDNYDQERIFATGVQQYHRKLAPEHHRNVTDGASARLCYSCEQQWPETLTWPPPREKIVGNVRVTIQQNESNEEMVAGADNTRSRAAVNHPEVTQPVSSTAQHSIFDRLSVSDNTNMQERQGALAEIMYTVFSNTSDDVAFLNSLEQMIAVQRATLIENERLEQQRQAESERIQRDAQQRRVQRQAAKRQAEEEERARKELVAQRKQEEREKLSQQINASITGRNLTNPADTLVDDIQSDRRIQQQEVPEPPPLPSPPRPPPPGPAFTSPVFVPLPPSVSDGNPVTVTPASNIPPPPPLPENIRRATVAPVQAVQPPPPPSVDTNLAVVHNWIPSKMGKVSLRSLGTLHQILEHWTNIRLFEQQCEDLQQHWSRLLTCHNEYEHNYIRAQPTVYHSLQDYVLIWRAIISNEMFHEIFKFVDDRTYWEETQAPPGMLVDTGPGTGGNRQHYYGHNAYRLSMPYAELSTSNKITVAQQFQGEEENFNLYDLPFRRWDVVIVRTYKQNGNNLTHSGTFLVVLDLIYLFGDGLLQNGRSVSYEGFILARDNTSYVGSNVKSLRSGGTTICSMHTISYLGNQSRSLNSLVSISTFGDKEVQSLLLGRPRLDINLTHYEPTTRSFRVSMLDTATRNPGRPDTSDDVLIDVTAQGEFTARFMQYITTFYEQHLQESQETDATVVRPFRSMNKSQAMAVAMMITKAGAETDSSVIRRKMSGLVGPAGTGKTRTLIHAVAAVIANVPLLSNSILEMEQLRRQWQNNPTPESEAALLNHRPTHAARILILTPTNNSLDVIEDMLLEGIPVLDVRQNEWVRCHVYYRRTGNLRVNNASSVVARRVRAQRTRIFPQRFQQLYNNGLVLSTCASSYQAFPPPQQGRRQQNVNFNRFTHVFIDEASQISDDDIFVPLEGFCQTMSDYGDWPFISIIADNEQKTKFSHATPSPYYYTLKCSLFDRFLPQTSRVVPGKNNFRCLQLDTQYRMHPMISNLANSITLRTVHTSYTPGHNWKSESYDNCQLYYFGSLRDLTPAVLRPAVMWFDPYVSVENTNDAITTWLRNNALEDDGFEQSPEEVAFVVQLFRLLVDSVGINFEDVLILTTYNRQRRLVERALQHFIPDTFGGQDGMDRVRQVVATVGTVEGNEAWAVIYTSGRSPQDQREVGENSLIDDLRDIHVITTRAKRHMFYVGNLEFFSDSCTNWSAVTDLVTPRTGN